MELFESGLFAELGEVVGYDPVLYEDIPKQQHDFSASSLADSSLHNEMESAALPWTSAESQSILPVGDLDGLLAEGHELLEQLMTANGLDLPTESMVDLANIDELSAAAEALTGSSYDIEHEDLLSDLHELADPQAAEYMLTPSPSSTISTLPSEPSSPIDLFSLQEPSYAVTSEPASTGFNDLLQSLIDDSGIEAADLSCSYELASSPTPSSCSSFSVSSPGDQSWSGGDADSISSSPYPEEINETPSKPSKAKKSRSTPYSKLPAGRKERKKKQNKEAAIRYREKKRLEAQTIVDEETQLTDKNNMLKTEVLNLEREIMCMKELLSDVFNVHSL